jgi:Uma2 family endonuclease
LADGFAPPLPQPDDGITRRRLTVSELNAMFDAGILSREDKLELIEGELFEMNSQMMRHGIIKHRLARSLTNQVAAMHEVYSELTVQLGSKSLVDPDIIITLPLSPEPRYVQAEEVYLAIEVSVTSLSYDLGKKAKLYAKAGFPEMWVIDVEGTQTWVHREPNALGYGSIISVPFDQGLEALVDGTVKVVVAELLT